MPSKDCGLVDKTVNTDDRELYKLSESGISAINLTYKENGFKDIYPMDFKVHRDGKGANPREHR
ncbi:hypothetical protein [Photorhabdus akhurstii]|uniref:hypothetical protein n=1 Tax=Photorhabdus akhurstii TaxID=171438 RepID=UPI000D495624|nr:hypothetical protein C6H69_13730 [Photorhabdus luminescens]